MTAVSTQRQDEANATEAMLPSERRCLASGEVKPKTSLVRFALHPVDGSVVPDIYEKLPGRGLWVSADRALIDEACRKNLFIRASKGKAKPCAGLADQVEGLLHRRCLELLGLSRSAGSVVVREQVVEEAARKGDLVGLLFSADAGQDIRRKLSGVSVLSSSFSRDDMGAALGREQCPVVGLRPHTLTDKLCVELARWHGVRASTITSTDLNGSSNLT